MSRILVEASAAFDQGAGIGRYSRNMLDRLVPGLPDHQFTAFYAPARQSGSDTSWSPPAGVRNARYPLSRKRFDQLHHRLGTPLPVRPFTGAQDLVYSPDFSAPRLRGARRIVTIHDVAFLTHPQLITDGMRAYLTRLVEREIEGGSHLVAVSQATKDRLGKHFGIQASRISIVPNGVEPRFFQADAPSSNARRALGLPDAYLLMVGTLEPRKNHEAVLRCVDRREAGGLPVVIVGRKGWGTEHLIPMIARCQRAGKVLWLDDIGDADLPAVYAGATGVLYPSWTEGFGLPVLEALAAGKPVVTGNDPVFEEVAGSLAFQVDPADDGALLDAIAMLEGWRSSEEDEQARQEHAAKYSWDQAARQLIEIVDRMARN